MGLSAIDFLTGILNRRAFQKSVEDEMYKKTPGVFKPADRAEPRQNGNGKRSGLRNNGAPDF